MVVIELKRDLGSQKLELGEIDTSSPFESVKDAINLFCGGVSSGKKPSVKKTKDYLVAIVFSKEIQLHLAHEKLNKLKEQLEKAETTKSQACAELDKAKLTVDELNCKLKVVSESKDFAAKEVEEAKNEVQLIEQGNHCITGASDDSMKVWMEAEREKYSVAIGKLDSVKQLLRSIRQEHDASLAGMTTAINQAAEAELAAKVNKNIVDELSRKIASLQESISQLKSETVKIQGDEAKILNQKSILQQLFNANIEESAKKLEALRKKFDPKLSENLEMQLASTVSDILVLQSQIDYEKTSNLDSLQILTSELDGAKESLHNVVEEECSMRSLVESLSLEMDNVKNEQSKLKEMETAKESNAEKMRIKIQKAKLELEEALNDELKVRGASEAMISTLHKLVIDSENAKHEVEEMIKQTEELKQKSESTWIFVEVERKLAAAKHEVEEMIKEAENLDKESESTDIFVEAAESKQAAALEDAKEAKTAERSALKESSRLPKGTDSSRTSSSEPVAHISISREEFQSLNRKVEESDGLADIEVAAVMAGLEAVKASENEAMKKLEALQKEIDEMNAMTHDALKKTEMNEAAKKAVQGELRRWCERELKVAEAASLMSTESEMSMGSSPLNYKIQKLFQSSKKPEHKVGETASRMSTGSNMSSGSSPLNYHIKKLFQPSKKPEQKVAEAASRMSTESKTSSGSSPQNYDIQKLYQPSKKPDLRKLKKSRSSKKKKVSKPNLSCIEFHKRNKVEGGSPYFSGEIPM